MVSDGLTNAQIAVLAAAEITEPSGSTYGLLSKADSILDWLEKASA